MNSIKCITVGISIAIAGITMNYVYRPFVYKNNINDCYLADVIGSLLAIPAASFFLLGVSKKRSLSSIDLSVIYFAFLSSELFSITGIHGTFDVKDLFALTISFVLMWSVRKKMKKA